MTDRNKQVALRFIEAMSTNDPVLAAECMAPDGVAVTKGYSKFAGSRPADVVIATIDTFKGSMPTGLRLAVETVMADGDKVVIEAKGNAVTGEGKPYCNEYCFVFTIADGKVKQINEYLCSAYAEEVLWPLVEKLGAPAAEAR